MIYLVELAVEISGKKRAELNVFKRFYYTRFARFFVAFKKLHKRVVAEFFLRFGREKVFQTLTRKRRQEIVKRTHFNLTEQRR